jgi:trehalose 6-phosphate synthase
MARVKEDQGVVLVSNRGPVSFVREDGGFGLKRGAGGLAGALDPVARRLGDRAVWIASATSDEDREAVEAGADKELRDELGYPVRLLAFDPDIYSGYYDVVSNRMLWFANHCLWDELGFTAFGEEEIAAWEDCYQPVNAKFAQAVLETSDPESLVLFQDYHLSTAPGNVRRARPDQAIFHFTHSSFCGPEGFKLVPDPIPRTIIEGMLGANLLGFHVPAWSEGFMRAAESIGARVDRAAGLVGHEGRRTWVRSYPIPIEVEELRERASTEQAQHWAEQFESDRTGPLIVRADRIEPSKNVIRGFEAFERLLDRREDLRGKARFIACLYPSRESMDEYQRYSDQVEESVARINERYPDAIDLFAEDDFDRTLGAYLVYDVLLVNSIMDGMNLVSKEGPAVNKEAGVVVLSTSAGSFEELGDHAIAIPDALDVDATSKALEEAIDMPPEERAERAKRLRAVVEKSRPETWIETQIEDLASIQSGSEPATPSDSERSA